MKRRLRSDRGSTTAELALILPVFLLVLFGIVEGSVVLGAWMTLTNETREAARYAIAGVRDGDTNLVSEVQTLAQNDLSAVLSCTPTVNATVASDGVETTSVTVTASCNVPLQTPFTRAVLGASVPVSVSSTMRAE